MSSFYAPYSTVGLMLNQSEFDAFYDAYRATLSEEDAEYLDTNVWEHCELFEYKFKNSMPQSVCNDTTFTITELSPEQCDCIYFTPFHLVNGEINAISNGDPLEFKEWDRHTQYVIFAEKRCEPLTFLTKNFYESIDHIFNEFIERMDSYLPDDFNYNTHVGYIEYCFYA